MSGALADRLVPVTHYNGTPIAAENIVRPILGWEKNPSGPGWPTGDVELDNPPVPHDEEPSAESSETSSHGHPRLGHLISKAIQPWPAKRRSRSRATAIP